MSSRTVLVKCGRCGARTEFSRDEITENLRCPGIVANTEKVCGTQFFPTEKPAKGSVLQGSDWRKKSGQMEWFPPNKNKRRIKDGYSGTRFR